MTRWSRFLFKTKKLMSLLCHCFYNISCFHHIFNCAFHHFDLSVAPVIMSSHYIVLCNSLIGPSRTIIASPCFLAWSLKTNRHQCVYVSRSREIYFTAIFHVFIWKTGHRQHLKKGEANWKRKKKRLTEWLDAYQTCSAKVDPTW